MRCAREHRGDDGISESERCSGLYVVWICDNDVWFMTALGSRLYCDEVDIGTPALNLPHPLHNKPNDSAGTPLIIQPTTASGNATHSLLCDPT